MYKITKEFSFCASHRLEGLPADHPCIKVHGHNYIVVVELQSAVLDKTGMVVDYRKLDLIKQYIDNHFDHNHLNDILEVNPTAENIAKHIFDIFDKTYPQLISVMVKEDNTKSVRYSPLFVTGKLSGKELADKINKSML